MNTFRLFAAVLVPTLLVIGCASHAPVPVIDRSGSGVKIERPVAPPGSATPPIPSPVATYTVKKGDTLYSIALDQGHDYKDLAVWNNLDNPNLIKVGQSLRLGPADGSTAVANTASVATIRPISAPAQIEIKPVTAAASTGLVSSNTEILKHEPKGGKLAYSDTALARLKEADGHVPVKAIAAAVPEIKPAEPAVVEKPVASTEESVDWAWPVSGKVQTGFSEGSSKGIQIPGKLGDPVIAAAPGKVVYAGSGLRGYGKLVIVRHNAEFLSAYAHNNQILVKEGQMVTRGQKIAELGSTDTESPRLHFEIRRQGKPVDPQKYLPTR